MRLVKDFVVALLVSIFLMSGVGASMVLYYGLYHKFVLAMGIMTVSGLLACVILGPPEQERQ